MKGYLQLYKSSESGNKRNNLISDSLVHYDLDKDFVRLQSLLSYVIINNYVENLQDLCFLMKWT